MTIAGGIILGIIGLYVGLGLLAGVDDLILFAFRKSAALGVLALLILGAFGFLVCCSWLFL